MKKILIPLMTVAVSLFVCSSCTFFTADLFDKSSSERLNEATAAAHQVLMGAANGWLVEYYPEKNQKYGGFNLHFKFNERTAIVRSELDPTQSKETIYQMLEDMGPTVNFTEYNTLLHYFSNPITAEGGGSGLGFEGDYEFAVLQATPAEVILLGKKTKNIIRLIPFTASSWESYCQPILDLRLKSTNPFGMTINGISVGVVRESGRYNISYNDGGNNKTALAGFIATPTGIKFYEPITIFGQTMQNFTLNTTDKKLVCTDAGANAEISFTSFFELSYELFLGTYTMNFTTSIARNPPIRDRVATVTLVEKEYGVSYYLKGILPAADEAICGGITVLYDEFQGIEIRGQILFTRTTGSPIKDFWWILWKKPGNNALHSEIGGMMSAGFILKANGKVEFIMVDSGRLGTDECAGWQMCDYTTGTTTGAVSINGAIGVAYCFFPQFIQE